MDNYLLLGVTEFSELLPKITMLQQRILRMYHMLALALCVSASEEFDWTKNERTSFYYGTFPTGRTHINNNIIIHKLPKDSLNFS